jgi:hypothetical protein
MQGLLLLAKANPEMPLGVPKNLLLGVVINWLAIDGADAVAILPLSFSLYSLRLG